MPRNGPSETSCWDAQKRSYDDSAGSASGGQAQRHERWQVMSRRSGWKTKSRSAEAAIKARTSAADRDRDYGAVLAGLAAYAVGREAGRSRWSARTRVHGPRGGGSASDALSRPCGESRAKRGQGGLDRSTPEIHNDLALFNFNPAPLT